MCDFGDRGVRLQIDDPDPSGRMNADWVISKRPLRETVVHDAADVKLLSLLDPLVRAGVDHQRLARTEEQSSALRTPGHANRLVGHGRRTHRRTGQLETIAR